MSNEIWDQTQVAKEAHTIEAAARRGDSSQAFREEDSKITHSSLSPEVRRANAAAVTAKLEQDGYLPVCGFDLARASGQTYKAPTCGEALASQSNMLTNSPSESIERAIYSKENWGSTVNLQFGNARPALPTEQPLQKAETTTLKSKSVQDELRETAKLLEDIKALRKNAPKNDDIAHSGKGVDADKHPRVKVPDTDHPQKHTDSASKAKEAGEALKAKEAADAKAREAEQAVARSLLKEMVAKIDLQSAVKRVNSGEDVTRTVRVTTDKDGTVQIAGGPYGKIDLDAKAKLKLEQDGSVTASDSKGKTYHFLSKPDVQGMVFETNDNGNIEKKYGPNNAKLISETITPKADGGYKSVKQYNKEEQSEEDFDNFKTKNSLNTPRPDWITSTEMDFNSKKQIVTRTLNYGRSAYLEDGEVRKTQEVFHYKDGQPVTTGVNSEHFYDNGFKYTELATGQTYLQRRVVAREDDPVRFQQQADKNGSSTDLTMRNGSVMYQGKEWALSNKLLRPDVQVSRTQRELPETYRTWYTEGELDP